MRNRVAQFVAAAVCSASITNCLHTTASCVERDSPDNTCNASYYIWTSDDCAKVPGCSSQLTCVASTCDPQTVRDAQDAGIKLLCNLDDRVACAQLAESECASNTKCLWTKGCNGTPTVNCSSIKKDVECMAYPICFWQVSGG